MRTKIDWRSGSKENYNDFCKKNPSVKITFDNWRNIIYTYNESFKEYILETGDKAKLPYGFGEFSINKKKRRRLKGADGKEFVNLPIDWQKTKEKGKVIYNFNLSSTNNKWTIGVTIRPDRTYQGGACQTVNNNDIGREFKSILRQWQEEYNLEANLWDVLLPLSKEEIERRKRAKDAERFIIKKTITDAETGRERPITAEDIKGYVREFGADVNKDNGIALVNAVEDDDYERAKTILQLGGSPNLRKGSDSAIARSKNMEMIKLLVSNHAILTGDVFNNIVCDEDALEFCLKAGADPNFNSNLPIRKVCKGTWKSLTDIGESYFAGYEMLLKYGVATEENGKNFVVKWASEYGRMDIINDQMSKGCKTGFVEAFTWMGHTRKLPNEGLKKQVGLFLKENALKYEANDWKDMCEKLERRGKKPWVEEM